MSLESDPYCLENVPLDEVLYGKNLISLGGLAAVDYLFSGIEIKGLSALDIGFGLGGVAFYLADHYQMKVSGVELKEWMVTYAKDHSPVHLTSQLTFNTYNNQGEMPYSAHSFDLVYSKGVLNHVFDKESLFIQIYNVLKTQGLFVIADWIFPTVFLDDSQPLVCETKKTYEHVLKSTGFDAIEFRDDTHMFLGYVKVLLQNCLKHRDFIENTYGKAAYSMIWNQHQKLLSDMQEGHKFAVRIVAKLLKPDISKLR